MGHVNRHMAGEIKAHCPSGTIIPTTTRQHSFCNRGFHKPIRRSRCSVDAN